MKNTNVNVLQLTEFKTGDVCTAAELLESMIDYHLSNPERDHDYVAYAFNQEVFNRIDYEGPHKSTFLGLHRPMVQRMFVMHSTKTYYCLLETFGNPALPCIPWCGRAIDNVVYSRIVESHSKEIEEKLRYNSYQGKLEIKFVQKVQPLNL